MKYILATKEYMTQIYDENGVVFPATVLSVEPNTVTQIKNTEKDGYNAIQIGYGVRKEKNVNKAQRSKGLFKNFREYRIKEGEEVSLEPGAVIAVDEAFQVGDKVDVAGIAKAKGFQGVVKRHGFHGGPRTHGQKHTERSPGSIGGGLRNRVPKGMRMAGIMGGKRISVKNLAVVGVDAEKNQLLIGGAVPGRQGTLVEVKGV